MNSTPDRDPDNLRSDKPGFYSHQFDDAEVKDLEALLADGLQDEIDMLRVTMRRVMALADGGENLDKSVRTLNSLSLASIRLARLLQIQKLLGYDNDRTERAIISAISSIQQEFRLSI